MRQPLLSAVITSRNIATPLLWGVAMKAGLLSQSEN